MHLSWVFFMHTCYSVISYMFAGFTRYSVDLKISYVAHKLTWTFRVIKKKYLINNLVGLEEQIVKQIIRTGHGNYVLENTTLMKMSCLLNQSLSKGILNIRVEPIVTNHLSLQSFFFFIKLHSMMKRLFLIYTTSFNMLFMKIKIK